MCGIAGIYSTKNSLDTNAIIGRMTDIIAHRGPDGQGCFTDGDKVGLGHRRLSIIDVSEAANQPFYSNCGNFVIVFNGEIYNYLSIKKKLPDYSFKTSSDTEVLLAAYIKWGEDFLQHLNGMFSFAIYNKEKKSLFAARDRLGIKPFYFTKKEDLFIFSSEIKQLTASQLISKKIDKKGLVQYFKNKTVYAPNTILEDVKMLEAGSFIYCDSETFKIKKYWNLLDKYNPEINNKDYDETKKDINGLLLDSVSSRMTSDVPLGAFLSGGIDSSIIVGLASKISKINTIAITFDEDKYDESKYSRIIANKFNTNHHEVNFKANQLLDNLPFIMESLDHPSIDGVNTHFVSQKAKEAGLTVSMSGLGGDELFAGYYYFKWGLKYNKYLKDIPPIGNSLNKGIIKGVLNFKENVSLNKLYEYFNEPSGFQNKYHIFRQLYFSHQLNNIFTFQPETYPYHQPEKESVSKFPFLSQFSYLELTTYMENVLLRDTDQMSMASSLEVRVPFLDHRLVEYVMSVSDSYKYPTYPKKLLIESVGDLLPPEIYNRKKMGFTFPWEHWLRKELKEYANEKICSLANREEFNSDYIISLWDDFLNYKKGISFSRIWLLVSLEATFQNYNV